MTQTPNSLSCHVLVVAAGRGQRMGADTPKQFMPLAGSPLLRHTLEAVFRWPQVSSVSVVIHPDDAKLYHDTVQGLELYDPVHGGETRKDSVYNGLKSLSHLKDEDIVLIHDAARLFVTPGDITKMLVALQEHRAVSMASAVTDTLRRADGSAVPRDDLFALQTPQAFRYGDIMRAHESAPQDQTFTDDTAIAAAAGIESFLLNTGRHNIKITTPEDLEMAQKLLQGKTSIRTGMGFDVHKFEDTPSPRKLILCGVHVPHNLALTGHSDADVALHAITDALLGAAGLGDIGRHFPPSDAAYKDMDSALFLEKAVVLLAGQGAKIRNIDVTLICEQPQITPHAPAMQERIAQICGIKANQVNIKATTTEGLGFTGRSEGIAAQAVATISMPEQEGGNI